LFSCLENTIPGSNFWALKFLFFWFGGVCVIWPRQNIHHSKSFWELRFEKFYMNSLQSTWTHYNLHELITSLVCMLCWALLWTVVTARTAGCLPSQLDAPVHGTHGRYLKAGKLVYFEDFADGLDNAPNAFYRMLNGSKIGKQIITVAKV
jgi:hypothetical protein